MKSFPLFVNMAGETVVIAGGGETAAQKARLLARTDADLVFMAPELNDELAACVASGRARHIPERIAEEALAARLVIATTDCAETDEAIAALARQKGALVNVVDRPALCDVTMPAIVDRDPVVVAIGTEGAAPVLARQIKSMIEAMLEPRLGKFAAYAGSIRSAVAENIAPANRRAFWEWFFQTARSSFASGDDETTKDAVFQVVNEGGPAVPDVLTVAVLDTEGVEADLITLRALARLQRADLIVHGPDAPVEILDLARRDAVRSVIDQASNLSQIVGEIAEQRHVVVLNDGQSQVAALIAKIRFQGADIEEIPGVVSETPPPRLKLAS
ncbi:siroheme synthase [Rhodobacteraceae bacterium NNCM2]|nr:siroheme synthase [Coraliihabitans acroporae]